MLEQVSEFIVMHPSQGVHNQRVGARTPLGGERLPLWRTFVGQPVFVLAQTMELLECVNCLTQAAELCVVLRRMQGGEFSEHICEGHECVFADHETVSKLSRRVEPWLWILTRLDVTADPCERSLRTIRIRLANQCFEP